MVRIVCFVMLLAGPLSAEVPLGEHPAFQTRFGLLQVHQVSEFEQGLSWNGQPIQGASDFRLSIAGAWGLPGTELDWVLIAANHGGNMCPGTWFLGRVDRLGIALSERFGDCAGGRVLDLRVFPAEIQIDIPHPDIAIDVQTIRFTGASLTVTLAEPVLGEGQAGQGDPRRWLGQHPMAALRDPDEQARFLTIMPENAFRLMVRQIGGPGGPTIERDGWVLGAACMAHQCNAYAAVWGIRLADGAAAATLLEAGGRDQHYGVAADPAFQRFVAENRF